MQTDSPPTLPEFVETIKASAYSTASWLVVVTADPRSGLTYLCYPIRSDRAKSLAHFSTNRRLESGKPDENPCGLPGFPLCDERGSIRILPVYPKALLFKYLPVTSVPSHSTR